MIAKRGVVNNNSFQLQLNFFVILSYQQCKSLKNKSTEKV